MDVTFYHQVRADGGRRTGMEVDQSRGIEEFVPCDDPDASDPTLRWYVDVTWDVPEPPATQEEARAWYAAHLPDVRGVLESAAGELAAGFDSAGMMPWVRRLPTALGEARVAVAAQRRYDGATVAQGIHAALARDVDPLARKEVAACAAG